MSDLMELVNECEAACSTGENMSKIEAQREKAHKLYDLGLTRVAQEIIDKVNLHYSLARVAEGKYVRITDAKIQAFLDKKAAAYDKKQKVKPDAGFADVYRTIVRQHIVQQERRRGLGGLGGYVTTSTYDDLQAQFNQQLDVRNLMLDGQSIRKSESKRLVARTVHSGSTDPKLIGQFHWNEVPLSQYQGIPPAYVLTKLAQEKEKGIFQEYRVASVNAVPDPLLLGVVKGCEDRFYLAQWGNDVSLDEVI